MNKNARKQGVKAYITYEQRESSFVQPPTRKGGVGGKKGTKSQKWVWPKDNPTVEAVRIYKS
jgi:hypothetical protein